MWGESKMKAGHRMTGLFSGGMRDKIFRWERGLLAHFHTRDAG